MSTVGIKAPEGMESSAPPPTVEAPVVTAKPTDTVFSVLAAQARARTTTELRTTALGCAVSAGLCSGSIQRLAGSLRHSLRRRLTGRGAYSTARSSMNRGESNPTPEHFGFCADGEKLRS